MMKNKYWALILIGMFILTLVAGFISYNIGLENGDWKGYEKGLETGYNNGYRIGSDDGYAEGYETYKDYCNEYKEWWKKRISYCFSKCSYGYSPGTSGISRTCMWDCFHPDYGIAKINTEDIKMDWGE